MGALRLVSGSLGRPRLLSVTVCMCPMWSAVHILWVACLVYAWVPTTHDLVRMVSKE